MGCDGFITFKILELLLSIFCIIFKRVTDDKSNKLFYFREKNSREWPLLKNIFWDENGAIFADMTYGGFVVICTGLIIGQAAGELRYAKYTENFLLTMGALMYFGSASLELAALDQVDPHLVVNAAVLGVISLITGLIFIIDLLLAGRRRKRPATRIRSLGYDKPTQTDNKMEALPQSTESVFKKVPTNGVKILPSSPMEEPQTYPQIPVTNSNNEFVGMMSPAQPIYTAQQLKSPTVKIKSTESFLRSEKGEMPVLRATPAAEGIFVPPGYVLMPKGSEGHTPPGYASVEPAGKMTPRKLQSPTITTTKVTPAGYYYQDSRDPSPIEDTQDYGKYPARDRPWQKSQSNDDIESPFRRNSPYRSSKQNMRYDSFPADEGTAFNGHKIEEELRMIKNITKSDADLASEIEKENQELKDVLRKEKEAKMKLQAELKKAELEERKRLEERLSELEEYQAKLEKELRMEERKKLEQKIKELEEEKDRRMSENIQFFGVNDLHQSKKDSSPVIQPKLSDIEEYFKVEADRSKGAKEMNVKLREKHSDEELRRVIEEGFHFLDEEERKKRSDRIFKEVEEHRNQTKSSKDPEKRMRNWREIDVPARTDTPGGASYKSEAQLWLNDKEERPLSPKSPKDPGYVLQTVQNWPDPSSPAERYKFSSRKANQAFRFGSSASPSPELLERGSSEEDDRGKGKGRGRGMLIRKVEFPDSVAVETERPASVTGSQNTWRRWLQNSNKPKLHSTRSTPA